MSNGVHPRQQRSDTGSQPEPHYCTTRPRSDGTIAGCPNWPSCLFSVSEPVDVTPDPMLLRVEEPPPVDNRMLRALGEGVIIVGGVVLVLLFLWALVA